MSRLKGTDIDVCKCGHTYWEHQQYQAPGCNCWKCKKYKPMDRQWCEYRIKEHTEILNRLIILMEERFNNE